MGKVIELLGIIEEIFYDEVMNEFEIQKLKDWLEINRDLKLNDELSKKIKELEIILRNNNISDAEKAFIRTLAKEYLRECDGIQNSLIVLNGLIEGIICDNIINGQEVSRLHLWLKKNAHLKKIKEYKDIYVLINGIVKNNIITGKEQKALIDLMSKSMIFSKSNLRVDYLIKKVANHENIGINLIESIDDDSLIEIIHERAQMRLLNILNSYSGYYPAEKEIIFISLALIGLKRYNGDFYSNVENIYENLYDKFSSQKIEGKIRSIINGFRNENSSKRERIINTVLMNAIVPQHYLPDFFEFIFDIYRLNFDYTLDENMHNEFRFVYEGICESLDPCDDEFHFNTTKKVYKLIQSTKQLILHENDFKSMIQLSCHIIKLIDKHYWEEDNIIVNSYFNEGYREWVKKYYNNVIQKHDFGQSRSVHYTKWKPSFELEGNKICIMPPKHKIKSSYSYSSIKIIVENKDEIIYKNETPYIQEIFGGYQINSEKIAIDTPLSEIKYRVYSGVEIIYDSKQELFRDVIAFDSEGIEIENHTNHQGDVKFCYNYSSDVDCFFKSDKYCLGIKKVDLNTVLVFGKTMFSFSSIDKLGIIGVDHKNTFITNNQDVIPLYNKAEYLIFESEYPSSSLGLRINKNKLELSKYLSDSIEKGAHFKYVVKLPNLVTGIFSINVFRLDNDEVLKKSNFIVGIDPIFSYTVENLNDEKYNIAIRSSLLKSSISKQLNIRKFSDFKLDFFYDNTRFCFEIPFKIPMYQLDNQEWKPLTDIMWIDDIRHNTQVRFFGIDCVENEMRVVNENSLLDTIALRGEGNYFNASIGLIKKFKTNYEYVNLMWLNSMKQMDGLSCLNVCRLRNDHCKLVYDSLKETLNVVIDFIGKGNVCIKVLDCDEREYFRQEKIPNNHRIIIDNIKGFITYKIVIYEKTAGFSINKERVLNSFCREFFSYETLQGRSFKIINVNYDRLIRNQFFRKIHKFKNTYIQFGKMDDNLKYIGNLYITNKETNNYYLDRINPVEIEITGDLSDRYCELAITKDLDGLLLDFSRDTVFNNLDDPKATDIFSYIIDLKEME